MLLFCSVRFVLTAVESAVAPISRNNVLRSTNYVIPRRSVSAYLMYDKRCSREREVGWSFGRRCLLRLSRHTRRDWGGLNATLRSQMWCWFFQRQVGSFTPYHVSRTGKVDCPPPPPPYSLAGLTALFLFSAWLIHTRLRADDTDTHDISYTTPKLSPQHSCVVCVLPRMFRSDPFC